jgi:hypothetical protein
MPDSPIYVNSGPDRTQQLPGAIDAALRRAVGNGLYYEAMRRAFVKTCTEKSNPAKAVGDRMLEAVVRSVRPRRQRRASGCVRLVVIACRKLQA